MVDPLIVLVLIGPTAAADPMTGAMTMAARKAMNDGAVLLVSDTDALDDEAALGLAARVGASIVASVSWDDVERRNVRVHLHRPEGWFDRRYLFDPGDAESERGRTVGFALASLISGEDPGEEAPPTILLPATTAAEPDRVEVESPDKIERPAPRRSPPRARWSAELTTVGAVGGDASGVGAGAALRWSGLHPTSLRLSVAGRFGALSRANARSRSLVIGAGIAMPLLRTGVTRPFDLGVRADLLAIQHNVEVDSVATPAQARWLTGADLVVEWAWMVSAPLAIVGSVGGEGAFGVTHVHVGNDLVGTLPVLRAIGDLGARVTF